MIAGLSQVVEASDRTMNLGIDEANDIGVWFGASSCGSSSGIHPPYS